MNIYLAIIPAITIFGPILLGTIIIFELNIIIIYIYLVFRVFKHSNKVYFISRGIHSMGFLVLTSSSLFIDHFGIFRNLKVFKDISYFSLITCLYLEYFLVVGVVLINLLFILKEWRKNSSLKIEYFYAPVFYKDIKCTIGAYRRGFGIVVQDVRKSRL